MFRVILRFKRFRILVLPALTLALVAAAFFFTRQHQPVSAANAANAAVSSDQMIDLGTGYVMEVNGESHQILAPATVVHAKPVSNFQTYYIGLGYMFVFDADGGHVVAPSSQYNVQPVVFSQSTSVQTMYLTDGYVLILNGTNGHVFSPSANTFKVQPVFYPQSFYIGLGYQFVFNADGGHVVALGAP